MFRQCWCFNNAVTSYNWSNDKLTVNSDRNLSLISPLELVPCLIACAQWTRELCIRNRQRFLVWLQSFHWGVTECIFWAHGWQTACQARNFHSKCRKCFTDSSSNVPIALLSVLFEVSMFKMSDVFPQHGGDDAGWTRPCIKDCTMKLMVKAPRNLTLCVNVH